LNNQCGAETQGRLHFSVALHEKSGSPPGQATPWAVDSDLDFQVTVEKCRDCDGLKVLSWTEGVQGAVVHQLCRLRPLCKAAAAASCKVRVHWHHVLACLTLPVRCYLSGKTAPCSENENMSSLSVAYPALKSGLPYLHSLVGQVNTSRPRRASGILTTWHKRVHTVCTMYVQ
jgi:hypothetical protein